MPSEAEIDEPSVTRRWRRGLRWPLLAVLVLVVAAIALLWANRREIADNIIADELASRGIAATYEIERIGGSEQVLRNIVVGDPDRPDLTIERAVVAIRYRFGMPDIGRIRLERPRLFGTYIDGKLGFGALDPLLFTGEAGPFELPDLNLAVIDGRALIEGDHGPISLKLAGSGNLRDGFAGELAATAPRLSFGGCEVDRATAYGAISVSGRRPAFEGPLRVAEAACAEQAFALDDAAMQLTLRADEAMAAFDGSAGLRTGSAAMGTARLAALSGDMRFTWRDGGLTARYALQGTDLDAAQAALAQIGLDGSVRARRAFERIEVDARVAGRGVRPGADFDRTLADAASATEGTLLGPILDRIRRQLAMEGRNSRLVADVTVRRTGDETGVFVPSATLRGGSGESILSLSRFSIAADAEGAPRFAGEFATGGEGLPRIDGRLENRAAGGTAVRLSMPEYRADTSSLSVPELSLILGGNGAVGFAGEVEAGGALPGGMAERLHVPVSGRWSPAGGLAVWNECADLRFERLQLASLALAQQAIRLCPPRGSAMVRYDDAGLRIAAGAAALDLEGQLGETPVAIDSGPVGFAWPGAISARQIAVTLGPAGTASTFVIDDLKAEAGDGIAGTFADADVKLAATPIDLLGARGSWRYADGRLSLTDGSFRVEDRTKPERFEPLVAREATLALADNVIVAEALLREPVTDREITAVDLRHDLATGRGHADLAVRGILFDGRLQPQAPSSACVAGSGGGDRESPGLTCLAFGVMSNVSGTVTGAGRIDWNEREITSRGRFSSASLDLAVAFGPVRGLSGTVEFTDLLGMTTAPDQRLTVAAINPGIEVNDGEVMFDLREGELLSLEGATWPFLGGTLTMRPVDLRLGASEVRRYVLEMEGLDAALFLQRMDMANISADGTFDGTIPIVFNEGGNGRIEGGLLISRPPGGNLSYVGELTYEDLSPMANFAFSALRSLDYRQMRIAMDGPLTGEIVTQVRFEGVSQGEGTSRNIATRAIAGLPIRFDVNIRASFYELLGNLRSIYDPAAVRDPRSPDVGLLDAQGNRIDRNGGDAPAPVPPADLVPPQPAIQRRESEEMP